MSSSITERRRQLSEKIARERAELGAAYHDLAKPFQVADTGLAGMRILRKSGWLLALTPTAVNLAFSLLGWEKKGHKPPTWLGRFSKAKNVTEKAGREEAFKLRKPLARLAKHGWSLFKVYRRVRQFLP